MFYSLYQYRVILIKRVCIEYYKMFRRLITRTNYKKIDHTLENLNERVKSCQTQIDVLSVCMIVTACYNCGTFFIKTIFENNKIT